MTSGQVFSSALRGQWIDPTGKIAAARCHKAGAFTSGFVGTSSPGTHNRRGWHARAEGRLRPPGHLAPARACDHLSKGRVGGAEHAAPCHLRGPLSQGVQTSACGAPSSPQSVRAEAEKAWCSLGDAYRGSRAREGAQMMGDGANVEGEGPSPPTAGPLPAAPSHSTPPGRARASASPPPPVPPLPRRSLPGAAANRRDPAAFRNNSPGMPRGPPLARARGRRARARPRSPRPDPVRPPPPPPPPCPPRSAEELPAPRRAREGRKGDRRRHRVLRPRQQRRQHDVPLERLDHR